MLAKTCLPPLARGYLIPVPLNGSLLCLSSVLVPSLGRSSHYAEEALTRDPGYRSTPRSKEA